MKKFRAIPAETQTEKFNMSLFHHPIHPLQLILGIILILSSLGVILAKKPVHSCLAFLLTLLTLATLYLQESAQFIAVMQILVYAGGILVIFMFVMVLFQDAHSYIVKFKPQSKTVLLLFAGFSFVIAVTLLAKDFGGHQPLIEPKIDNDYGSVQTIGKLLYLDFFFPFEVVVLLFLVASIGALYIGKKDA